MTSCFSSATVIFLLEINSGERTLIKKPGDRKELKTDALFLLEPPAQLWMTIAPKLQSSNFAPKIVKI
jgi:hypothetical protein